MTNLRMIVLVLSLAVGLVVCGYENNYGGGQQQQKVGDRLKQALDFGDSSESKEVVGEKKLVFVTKTKTVINNECNAKTTVTQTTTETDYKTIYDRETKTVYRDQETTTVYGEPETITVTKRHTKRVTETVTDCKRTKTTTRLTTTTKKRTKTSSGIVTSTRVENATSTYVSTQTEIRTTTQTSIGTQILPTTTTSVAVSTVSSNTFFQK